MGASADILVKTRQMVKLTATPSFGFQSVGRFAKSPNELNY